MNDCLLTARARLAAISFLAWHIFVRDYRARYRRALFGIVWILTPMILLTVTGVVVVRELALPILMAETPPYLLTLVAGLLIWGIFSEGVSGPQEMCRRTRPFLRYAPIDYAAILGAALARIVFNFLIKLPVLIAAMIWYRYLPPPQAAFALPFLLALVVMGLALGALLAPISLVYFDIRYGLPFVLMVLLIISPVLYPVPESGLLRTVVEFNPIAHLLVTTRDLLFTGTSSFLLFGTVTALVTVALLAPLAILYYYRGMPKGIAHI